MARHFFSFLITFSEIVKTTGPQKMVDICKLFCDNHGLKISVDRDPNKSKTKCVQFNNVNTSPANIVLNNIPVPWSDSYKHLGHIISADEDMFKEKKNKDQ